MSLRQVRVSAALALALIGLFTAPGYAQLEENVLGLTDENLEGYLEPLQTGLSATMNSAIFRTGHVPTEGFHFSIGVTAMAIGYDDVDRTYIPTDPDGFTSLGDPVPVPTIVGDLEGVVVAGEDNLTQIYPGGFDLEVFEIGVPQISIGSLQGTRLLGRFLALDLGDSDLGDFSYIGFGIQHSITQWVPSLPADVAVGAFIQSFEIGDDVIKAKAFHANVTASRQFSVLQPYLGLGYDSLSLDVKSEDEEDPEFSIDAALEQQGDFHLTLGLLAKVPVVAFFFEYNAAAADGFSLGVDFGTN
ncbi:MAG: hypothetical protein KBD56_00335 [Candidatus Eisenbacteria bacterium]|nr:hypothetical protein [Candidatus Eisenbacteria bacterium]